MICLDEVGNVVRPAMLWNDPRPARAAADLVAEWGAGEKGRREWIRAVGLVPQPFHTVARLRWLADHETTNAARAAAVCLPHDWLTSRLLGDEPNTPFFGSASISLHRQEVRRPLLRHSQDQLMK